MSCVAGIFSILAAPALAHPHIFAQARLEVETAADGTIVELRNVWRFDEVFSASVVMDYDTNRNLTLEPEELAEVGAIVRDSLADFNYYTTLIDNGADLAVKRPAQIHADYQDGQLLLIFAVEPERTLALDGTVSVGVYDPTMYAAIDFATDADLVVTGAAADRCATRIVRPDPDQVIAENQDSLTEAFYETDGANDLSKLFATRIEFTCG
ncbi:DUF1007 family protein [Pseudohoeflea sp. DP4N28-3]|uniref:DUF1007 family protein n=2 Tax=Pseudohoeflea coraliihabitans TaxID=2860393 RepID=A0ABS6WKA0_9HYPH|nr:DUF1007 family protein [Pseudohoeflea sp. DP4N28-3]